MQQANKPQPAPQFGVKPLFPTAPPVASPQPGPLYVPAPTSPAPTIDNSDYYRYLQRRDAQNAQVGAQLGATLGLALRAASSRDAPKQPQLTSSQQALERFVGLFNQKTSDVRAEVIGTTLELHNPNACPQMHNRYVTNASLLESVRSVGFSELTVTNDNAFAFTINLVSPPQPDSSSPAPTVRNIAPSLLERFSKLPPGTFVSLAQGSDSYLDILERDLYAQRFEQTMSEGDEGFSYDDDGDRIIGVLNATEMKCHEFEKNTTLRQELKQKGFFFFQGGTTDHKCAFKYDLLTMKRIY